MRENITLCFLSFINLPRKYMRFLILNLFEIRELFYKKSAFFFVINCQYSYVFGPLSHNHCTGSTVASFNNVPLIPSREKLFLWQTITLEDIKNC